MWDQEGVKMGKYRKKPVVIEATQYFEWMRKEDKLPEGVYIIAFPNGDYPGCNTLEGPLRVSDGDWIIKGVNGEFYPCMPDIFEKTYERVE